MSVTKSCRDIKQLSPLAQTACNLFLAECKKQGVNIFITETYRSQERQNWLYEQGRTRSGQVVTWTKNSNHKGRMAWDIAVSPPNQLYDRNIINRAGKIAGQLGITWGGTWKTPDTPHFEIKSNWKSPKEEHKVKEIQINLNGVKKKVYAIEKDGNNYVKLQDLRDNKITIDYDSVAKIPVVRVK
ncbi:MAG TPA: M15 family metallopeptidase [Epulopiscium sp.]|nr:M15 family metallopeptidase [Candidatus Epulonipiscium sp.]